MRLRAGFVFVTLLFVAIPATQAQAPTPVVERISSQFGRTTRVTLFSNHVVVVAVRSETEDFVHQATLAFDEYMVYLQAMERAAGEVGNEPVASDVESRDAFTELTLHLGPDAPRTVRYSPLASLNLPTAKIASMIDDIQNRALSALPGEFEIKQWQPVVGDCVELRQGGEAFVAAVHDDGTIVLMQPESSVSSIVAMENRSEVILKVLERAP